MPPSQPLFEQISDFISLSPAFCIKFCISKCQYIQLFTCTCAYYYVVSA